MSIINVIYGQSIQSAIDGASAGDTIIVGPGTYDEDIIIDKQLTLRSQDGAATTIINGQNGTLGAIEIDSGVDGVIIGGPGMTQGFTIRGNNGNGAVENAAIYIQGNHDGITIEGNVIEARGDAGLLSEYSAVVTNVIVNGNSFTGQTFDGPTPEGFGFGTQFDLGNNVPRQLVTLGGNGANTSDVTFTNNSVSGTAGGVNIDGNPQGNTLVTIDAANSTIQYNSFTGFTNRYATALRAREDGTDISHNTFDASASGSNNTTAVYIDTPNPGAFELNTFIAEDGSTTIQGSDGQDNLSGTAGDDTFIAGAGNDVIDGLDGSDTYDASAATGGVTVDLDDNPFSGTSAGDGFAISGTTGIDGLTSIENVRGGTGNDVVNGSAADNTFFASAGDDQYDGSTGNDTYDASETSNGVAIDLGSEAATGPEIGSDTLTSIENAAGGSGDDTITGSDGDNELVGNGGNDTFHHTAGTDVISGGSGGDTISVDGASSNAEITFNSGNQTWELEIDGETTTLSGVESINFDDKSVLLVGGGSEFSLGDAIGATSEAQVDTILLADGDHYVSSQLEIDHDVEISGGGRLKTTVHVDFDTASSGNNNSGAFIVVQASSELIINDLTIDGTGHTVAAGIRSVGVLDVDRVGFNELKSGFYEGRGITVRESGHADINDSHFTEIGRIGVHLRGASVTGTVTDGVFVGKGDGDWLDYGIELGGGAVATLTGNEISGNTGTALSDGSTSAGIYATDFFGPGTDATLNDNNVHGNTASVAVGYDDADASTVTFGTGVDANTFTDPVNIIGDGTYNNTDQLTVDINYDGGPAALTFEGGAGNDDIVGGAGDDTLNGGAGEDTISGSAGADIIDGGVGNDTIYGNSYVADEASTVVDTAIYQAGATISWASDHWQVTDVDGTDDLYGIEKVTIGGQTYILADQSANGGFDTLQSAVDAASDSDIVLVTSGTWNGPGNVNVLVHSAITIRGMDGGFTVDASGESSGFSVNLDHDAGAGTVAFENLAVSGASGNGIAVPTGEAEVLGTLSLTNVTVENSGGHGLYVTGRQGSTAFTQAGVQNLVVTDSTFGDNGGNSSTGANIMAFEYDGDATLTRVSATNASAGTGPGYGIQFAGADASGYDQAGYPGVYSYDVLTALGNVHFEDVSVTGVYAKFGLSIHGYTDTTGLSFAPVGLGTGNIVDVTTGWGKPVFFDPMDDQSPENDQGTPGNTGSYFDETGADGSADFSNLQVIQHGAQFNELQGTTQDETITGTNANDQITGFEGADTLSGGDGDDQYITDGSDTIVEGVGEGIDTVLAVDSVTLSGNVENLTLVETPSPDFDGTGNSGDNIITGNSGDNNLSGLGGEDTISGGLGADIITGGAADDMIDGGGGIDTVIFSGNFENYTVTNGSFIFAGPDGEDEVTNAEIAQFDDAVVRLVGAGSEYTTIQAAINAANPGDIVLVQADTYTENLTITKSITLLGQDTNNDGIPDTILTPASGHGIALSGDINDGGAGLVAIENFAVNGATGAGVNIASSTMVDNLVITNSSFSNNAVFGVGSGSGALGVSNVDINNSAFTDNGQGGANGSGDIVLFNYHGNANIEDVTIDSTREFGDGVASKGDSAIQISGFDPSTYDVTAPIGAVTITNLVTSGAYHKGQVMIQGFNDLDGLSFTNVELNGNTNWGSLVFIDPIGSSGQDGATSGGYPGNYAGPGGTTELDLSHISINNTGPSAVDTFVRGSEASETITGTDGNDVLNALAEEENDFGGDDTVFAGGGNDTLYGGDGSNDLHGEAGDDIYYVDGDDAVTEALSGGADTVIATADHALAAGSEVETLQAIAGGGDIDLTGNEFSQTLTGNESANIFIGGEGDDQIDGNEGLDTASYAGNFADFSIDLTSSSLTVTDNDASAPTGGDEGADTLSGIEKLTFSDRTVFIVGNDSEYTSIQMAINDASEGDVVYVAEGTYTENLVIDKSISLIGAQADTSATGSARVGGESVIDGSGAFGITIEADNVTVSGFEITNFGRDGINIRTLEIEKPGFPDTGAYRTDVSLENNWIHNEALAGQKNGILVGEFSGDPERSDELAEINNVSITGNYIDLASTGGRGLSMTNHFTSGIDPMLTFTDLNIAGNTVVSGGDALFNGAPTNTFRIEGLQLTDNQLTGTVNTYNVFNSTISGNTITGIALLGIDGTTVSENTFNSTGYYGLGLFGDEYGANVSQNSTIESNTFNYNTVDNGQSYDGGIAIRSGADAETIIVASTNNFNEGSKISDLPAYDVIWRGTADADVLDAANLDDGDGGVPDVSLHMQGNEGNDTLTGGSQADLLEGGDNDDTLDGGEGDDIVNGGANDDTVNYTVGEGTDTVDGGDDNDTLIVDGTGAASPLTYGLGPDGGTGFELSVDGGLAVAGSNIEDVELNLSDLGDTVNIGDLNGTGIATSTVNINGGAGNDEVVVDAANPVNVKFDGGEGDDDFTGGAGNDSFTAGAGNNTFVGGEGSDTLILEDTIAEYTATTGTGPGAFGPALVFTHQTTGDVTYVSMDVESITFENGGPNVLIVGGATANTSIQAAVDAADANDIIGILPTGVAYEEDVTINKSVTILGANLSVPANDGTGLNGARTTETVLHNSTFTIAADNVIIDGLSFDIDQANETAIYLQNHTGLIVRNTAIQGDGSSGTRGVEFQSGFSGDISIEANYIDGLTSGVYVDGSGATITQNVISNNVAGVGSSNMSGAAITNNYFQDNSSEAIGADTLGAGNVINGNAFVTPGASGFIKVDYTPGETDTVNADGNWFDTTVPAIIAGLTSPNVQAADYLTDGTDVSADAGFQGNAALLVPTPVQNVTQGTGGFSLAIAVAAAAASDSLAVAAGEYSAESPVTVDVNDLTINAVAGATGISFVMGTATELTLDGDADINVTGDGDGETITGNDGDNVIMLGDGDDTANGGLGNDTIDYSDQTSGVTVAFEFNAAYGGGIGSDIIGGFENIRGGSGNDTLAGNSDDNTFYASLGNDDIQGKGGIDTYDASGSTHAITALLGLGTVGGTGVGSDTLSGIENVVGSVFNDNLQGDTNSNRLDGGIGNDTLGGGDGNDTLVGGAGNDTAVFAGSVNNFTISYASMTVIDNVGSGGTDTLDGIEFLTFDDGTFAIEDFIAEPKTDFNGNMTGDVLVQNVVTGIVRHWDGAATSSTWLGDYSSRTVIGAGDFDGNGTDDILFTYANGWMSFARSGNEAGKGNFGFHNGYTVIAISDFNGDGSDDALMSYDTTDYLKYVSGADGSSIAVGMQSGYSLAGVGDFNNDGESDLLLRFDSSGYLKVMLSADPGTQSAVGMQTDYSVAATGDFDGDGQDDVLLRYDSTGYLKFLSAANPSTEVSIGVQSGYEVAGAGDFDGDGKSDLLLEFGNGYLKYLSEANASQSVDVGTPTDLELLSIDDFNGDGKDDLLFVNTTTDVASYASGGNLSDMVTLGDVDGLDVLSSDFGLNSGDDLLFS